jgi:putative tryptophan/tyrosine transport system substrate-binding protein
MKRRYIGRCCDGHRSCAARQKSLPYRPGSSSHPVATLTETSFSPGVRAIFTELRRLGYVKGKNVLIERYSGEGRAAHYPDLARDVVRRNPDVIIAIGNDLVLDFKALTTTIPIVGTFAVPVETGVVASLARPGGNITGVSIDVGKEQWGKRIQLLKQVVPEACRFWALETRAAREQNEAEERELALLTGITLVGPPLERPVDDAEYRRVFTAVGHNGADAILISFEPENITNLKLIVELAEKNGLPTIYPLKVYVKAGGLMS